MRCCFAILFIVFFTSATAEVVDRIAVAVGNRAIKENQLDREVRLTEFFNGTPLDLSSAVRRKAADHLIDQTIIRAEMAKGSYPAPADADVNNALAKIKAARFHGDAEYQQALKTYGITEPELKAQIAWQLQVLRFIDLRFEPAVANQAIKNTNRTQLEERVNTAFFAWLDDSRKHTRIQFHDEVFQ